MIPNDHLIEAAHLNLHINQENTANLVFSVLGHISGVDPTTNKIKVVIPTWTNDNSTYMESGWVPLGTMAAGNEFGIQLLPFGGATATDPTGQNNAQNGNQPAAEQVLVHVLGRKKGLYVVGVQTFNTIDVPPTGYEDKSQVKAQAGEWLFKQASGSYLYFANDNTVQLEALTNPAPVLQTDQTPSDCNTNVVIASSAFGKNSNKNSHTVGSANGTIEIIADSSGATGATQSNLLLSAINPDAEEQAQTTTNVSLNSNVTKGSIGHANLDLVASSKGALSDNAEFTLEASTQSVGQAQGTINIDAGNIGTGQLDINVKGITGTLNILVDGTTNIMNVTVVNGIVNVTTDIVNVDCLEANVTAATATTVTTGNLVASCAGTAELTAGGTTTVTAPQTNVFSDAVILGNGTALALLNDLSAQVYNNHTHPAPGGTTGVPNEPITPTAECQNVFGS